MPKNTKKCQGFDSFQRLNYLFQIRDFMAVNVGNLQLSTYYGNLIDSIAKKSVLRIDPILKKQICKKCKGALLADVTATVKIKSTKTHPIVHWKCNQCGHEKKYPVRRNKKIWGEKPEAIAELLDYSIKGKKTNGKPTK